MKVIFLQNIKGTAQVGDLKDVNSGYARNFLLPRKLARPATSDAIKQAQSLSKRRELDKEKNNLWVNAMREKLVDKVIEIKAETNDEGVLYGSVDEASISRHAKQMKLEITPENILLPEHLKKVGDYKIEIMLSPDVKTYIKVAIKSNKETA